MSKRSSDAKWKSFFIPRSIAAKLNLSTLAIAVLICTMLGVYFIQETQDRIKTQANIELSKITDTLKLALEINSKQSNMIRIVGVLATHGNIDRLSVIKSSDMRIYADSMTQHNGKLASEVFRSTIMALLLLPTNNHHQNSGQLIGHNLHHAVQFHLIDPEVNRLRPYIIYLKYDKTSLEISIKQNRNNYLFILIYGFSLLLVINLWIQRVVILAPLSQITNQLKHEASNDAIPKPLKSTTKDEFNILINSYNHSIHKQLLQKKELEKYAQDLEFNNWALDEAREVAEATTRIKSEFLACMSHEIRTPMNGVLGMLTLLGRTQIDQSQQHHLDMAQSSAKSLLKLINDILDFSKIESGKLDIESVEFNLQQTLDELIQPLAIRAQEKNLEFVLDITQIKPVYIIGDPGRITQILTNLIGNAIKFTPTGSITVTGLLSSVNNGCHLIFSIEDTGIGMKEDKIESVFQPFSQADSSTTRYYGGTGLGLSIARHLSQLMGGEISVTSTEFIGSTFNFEINVKLPEQISIHQDNTTPDLDKLPILLLSTTPLSDNILEKILIGLDTAVTKLTLPSNADSFHLSNVENHHPKLIILSLPTGEQAIEAVLARVNSDPLLSQIPTLLNYSSIDAPIIHNYIKKQIYACFNKPISQAGLIGQLINSSQDKLRVSQNLATENSDDWLLTKYFGSTQPRLLLAEDNRVNQLVVEGIINEFGLEIEIANDGIQALELLEKSNSKTPYHLIFMDCQMPALDGYQTTQKIRSGEAGEIYRTIPIVAMTANAMVGDKEKCLSAGMSDYISKPLEPEHIKQALLTSLAYLIDEDIIPPSS
jgi:signal transduction histidine kinase/CheY-like chemotaxis protein